MYYCVHVLKNVLLCSHVLKNVLLCSHVFFLQMKTFKYKICIDNLLFEPSDWLRTKVLKMSHAG